MVSISNFGFSKFSNILWMGRSDTAKEKPISMAFSLYGQCELFLLLLNFPAMRQAAVVGKTPRQFVKELILP